jgi:hypothetical protein
MVARKQLFLIVPQQRFFRFTLDLHIHFFYSPLYFRSLVEANPVSASRWVAILFTVPTLIRKNIGSPSAHRHFEQTI